MPVKDKYWIIVLSCALVLSLIAIGSNIQNPIEPDYPMDLFGMAASPISPLFSTPISTFSAPSSITFTTTDTSKPLTFTVSDDAVYKTGYISIDGNSWQQVTLTGTVLGGNWFKGSTTGTISILKSQIGTGTNTNNYIIIYTCTRSGTSWDCHDNKWQIKDFTTNRQEAACTDTCSSKGFKCGTQTICGVSTNCGNCTSTQACTNNVCVTSSQTSTCTDRIKNGAETGIDCGGNCDVCATGKTFYVATNGKDSNPGTFEQPWATWQKGFDMAQPGDIIYIRGGTYKPTTKSGAYIANKDGTAINPIRIFNYPGEIPILDMSNGDYSYQSFGIEMRYCDYWHIKGLNIKGVLENPSVQSFGILLVHSSFCTIENCIVHDNAGAGISVGNTGSTGNIILNCDTYNNYDVLHNGESANGIEIVFGDAGTNVTVRGCRAWNNSDDGFDLWEYEGVVTMDSCWSFNNGIGEGDGMGFKLGATYKTPSAYSQRILRNCISTLNKGYGFDQNGANTIMTFYNNMAYLNAGSGYSLWDYDTNVKTVRNSISYDNGDSDCFGVASNIVDHNSWQNGITMSNADFVSLDTTQLMKPRKTNGGLPDITFGHLASGSDLINAGVNVGLPYSGSAPDLGAFETQ